MSFRTTQKGQVLVQVALLMVVLLAFAALAVDWGHVYHERRRMQNAADAGALAGAWEICHGDPTLWKSTAEDYATRNDAQDADATMEGDYIVRVIASETVDTYLAGIVGLRTVEVSADAAAACSPAGSICGLWPIAFREERWDALGCDEEFYVWNDSRFEDEEDLCDRCDCNLSPPDGDAWIIGPGHRSWVLFPRPEPPYPDEFRCADNCGSQQVQCNVEHDYEGIIDLPDPGEEWDLCLPGQTGVGEAVRHEIDARMASDSAAGIDTIVHILIWDRECDVGEPVTGSCPGTPYHILTTGCVQILDTLEIDLPSLEPPPAPEFCLQNVKVVKAKKLCDCATDCGSPHGGPGSPSEVDAVALIE